MIPQNVLLMESLESIFQGGKLNKKSYFFVLNISDKKQILITGIEGKQMEIIEQDGTTKVCKAHSFHYPLNIELASGALVNTSIIICGGYGFLLHTSCYTFGQDHQWKFLSQMKIPRGSGTASIPIPNGIWVTGNDNEAFNTTEIALLDGTIKDGPLLPEPRQNHCLIRYKSTIFLIGGQKRGVYDEVTGLPKSTSTVWIFDAKEELKFVGYGPNMTNERGNVACGLFYSNHHGGRPVIVAASSASSEYWDITLPGSKWKECSKSIKRFQH